MNYENRSKKNKNCVFKNNPGKVVTAEEHNIIGGLGGAVAECLAEKCPTKMYRIGVRDKFGESGSAGELLHKYMLDGEGVNEQVKAFVEG